MNYEPLLSLIIFMLCFHRSIADEPKDKESTREPFDLPEVVVGGGSGGFSTWQHILDWWWADTSGNGQRQGDGGGGLSHLGPPGADPNEVPVVTPSNKIPSKNPFEEDRSKNPNRHVRIQPK